MSQRGCSKIVHTVQNYVYMYVHTLNGREGGREGGRERVIYTCCSRACDMLSTRCLGSEDGDERTGIPAKDPGNLGRGGVTRVPAVGTRVLTYPGG